MRALLLLFPVAVATQALAQQRAPVVVSTAWLAEHSRDDKLVVLHVGTDASFTQGHIPGARPMPLTAFAPERYGLSTEIPDSAAFRELIETAGISNDSRIIVYSSTHPPQLAARLYITLELFGLGANTLLLDGGLRAWRAENRPIATEPAAAAPRGRVALRLEPDVITNSVFVNDQLGKPGMTIIDARDTRFWTGEQQNTQRAARPGRVPGARNVVFSTLVAESGLLLDRDALTAVFTKAGVPATGPVIAYCHVGQQASLVYIAARLLGHDVRLYDGSYEDWSNRAELRVETGTPPPQPSTPPTPASRVPRA